MAKADSLTFTHEKVNAWGRGRSEVANDWCAHNFGVFFEI